jgi:CheY-like chemotaxis protein
MIQTADLSHVLDGLTIVVIDDEVDSQEVAATLLEMCGANVITADNGQEGLEVIRKTRPVFAISDLSMPVMSGWEMLHELKKDRVTLDIPVVALTAHAMTGDRERAIMAGFHNYLTKPLSPENFIRDLLNVVMDIPTIATLVAAEQE